MQTGEQYFSTGGMKFQKHLKTKDVSPNKRLSPSLMNAEAAIKMTCHSNVSFESKTTPKTFNSVTLSPKIVCNMLGKQDARVLDLGITRAFVLKLDLIQLFPSIIARTR